MKSAADLDWTAFRRFSPGEWPEGALDHVDPRVIRVVSDVRDTLPASHRMDPHPWVGGHWRPAGSSRHSIRGGSRLSDAMDLYMDWAHVWEAWLAFWRHGSVGGLGIYTDQMYSGTEGDRAMIHFDLRDGEVLWVGWREDRHHPIQYVYYHTDPLEFHRLLAWRAKRA